MSWFVESLPELAPAELHRQLVGEEGAFWLRDRDRTFCGAFPVEASRAIDPEPGLVSPLGASGLPRWLGLSPYEAFRGVEGAAAASDPRPPAWLETCEWRRYAAVAVHDAAGLRVEGEEKGAVLRLVERLRAPPRPVSRRPALRWAAAAEPAALHEARIGAALEQIARGQLYQVNLARHFEFEVEGHPLEVLHALGACDPFSAALDFDGLGVVSGSPELFLDATADGRVETRPIKGTRPRGATPADDLRLRIELDQSEKEQAELTMVIDLERNDFSRLAEAGSVHVSELPHVVTHSTVHHREAAVRAQLRPGVDRRQLLEATMPSGSVTGAPKKRAMEAIRTLEPVRRGLYTGALGTLGHDGRLRLSMAIRVLLMREGHAHYFAGGGIVADSSPRAEFDETVWKARFLAPLLDVEN